MENDSTYKNRRLQNFLLMQSKMISLHRQNKVSGNLWRYLDLNTMQVLLHFHYQKRSVSTSEFQQFYGSLHCRPIVAFFQILISYILVRRQIEMSYYVLNSEANLSWGRRRVHFGGRFDVGLAQEPTFLIYNRTTDP